MSVSQALGFPFRNNNLLKILPIALVYGIVMYVLNYSTLNGYALVMVGAGIASFVFTLVIGGYYVSVVRRLQHHDERLPDVDFSTDIGQGCATMLAGILYMLPFLGLGIMLLCGAAAFGVAAGTADSSREAAAGGGMIILMLCAGALIAIPLMILLSAALNVGILRYAHEQRSGALFAFSQNVSLVTSNFGTFLGLFWRMALIGVLNGVITGTIGVGFNILYPQQSSPFFNPGTMYWLIYAFVQVATYTVTLVMVLSQYYVITQFGLLIGVGTSDKHKPDGDSFVL